MMETTLSGGFGAAAVEARVAGGTHPGRKRPDNQDNFLISDLSVDSTVTLRPDPNAAPVGDEVEPATPEARLAVGRKGALLLVADGMGGAAAGRLASSLAASFILAELQEGWGSDIDMSAQRFASRLCEAVEKANARIHQHAQRHPETIGMGSTVTAAGVLDGALYLAQIGDSRAYLMRGGVATQITRDQSLVQHMIDAGALRPEDAESSVHHNVILQALGVKPEVTVDITHQSLRRGDVLILCSDGLHRVVRPDEIAAVAARAGTPAEVCAHLIAMANERGGPDNVTVVAACFDGYGLPEPQHDDVVARTEFATPSGA